MFLLFILNVENQNKRKPRGEWRKKEEVKEENRKEEQKN